MGLTTTQNIARGERGTWQGAGRGDITGKNFLRQSEEKQRTDEALRNTRRALQASDPDVLLITANDIVYAVPRAAALAFVRAGMGES